MQAGTAVAVFDGPFAGSFGTIRLAWDGDGYEIENIEQDSIFRVEAHHLHPIRVDDFLRFQHSLCAELLHFSEKEGLFLKQRGVLTRDKGYACLVAKNKPPLHVRATRHVPSTARVSVRDSCLCFEDGSCAAVRLPNVTKRPKGRVQMLEARHFSGDASLIDREADVYGLTQEGRTFYFLNLTTIYHIPEATMRILCSPLVGEATWVNQQELARLQTQECVNLFDPIRGVLIGEFPQSGATRFLVSFLVPIQDFAILRDRGLRFSNLSDLHLFERADKASSRPLYSHLDLVVGMEVCYRGARHRVGTDEAGLLQLAGCEDVSLDDVAPDPMSFLHLQFLLAVQFLDFCETGHGAIVSRDLLLLYRRKMEILLDDIPRPDSSNSSMISGAFTFMAAYVKMNDCEPGSANTSYLLPLEFMRDIASEDRSMRAWLINVEAMREAYAHLIGATECDGRMVCNGRLCVVGEAIFVASFAVAPLDAIAASIAHQRKFFWARWGVSKKKQQGARNKASQQGVLSDVDASVVLDERTKAEECARLLIEEEERETSQRDQRASRAKARLPKRRSPTAVRLPAPSATPGATGRDAGEAEAEVEDDAPPASDPASYQDKAIEAIEAPEESTDSASPDVPPRKGGFAPGAVAVDVPPELQLGGALGQDLPTENRSCQTEDEPDELGFTVPRTRVTRLVAREKALHERLSRLEKECEASEAKASAAEAAVRAHNRQRRADVALWAGRHRAQEAQLEAMDEKLQRAAASQQEADERAQGFSREAAELRGRLEAAEGIGERTDAAYALLAQKIVAQVSFYGKCQSVCLEPGFMNFEHAFTKPPLRNLCEIAQTLRGADSPQKALEDVMTEAKATSLVERGATLYIRVDHSA